MKFPTIEVMAFGTGDEFSQPEVSELTLDVDSIEGYSNNGTEFPDQSQIYMKSGNVYLVAATYEDLDMMIYRAIFEGIYGVTPTEVGEWQWVPASPPESSEDE